MPGWARWPNRGTRDFTHISRSGRWPGRWVARVAGYRTSSSVKRESAVCATNLPIRSAVRARETGTELVAEGDVELGGHVAGRVVCCSSAGMRCGQRDKWVDRGPVTMRTWVLADAHQRLEQTNARPRICPPQGSGKAPSAPGVVKGRAAKRDAGPPAIP